MNRIAGNLQRWPADANEIGVSYEFPVMRAGMRSLAHIQRFDLPGSFHLLIGRDVQVRSQLSKMLTDALVWAVVVVGMLATIGALVIRSLFSRTLANISATTAAIAAATLPSACSSLDAAMSSIRWPTSSTTCWSASAG